MSPEAKSVEPSEVQNGSNQFVHGGEKVLRVAAYAACFLQAKIKEQGSVESSYAVTSLVGLYTTINDLSTMLPHPSTL